MSQFSGTMYIDKNDYAIVKIIEHWNITDFPEEHRQGLNLKGDLSKFIQKEYKTETIETDFEKIKGNPNLSVIGHITEASQGMHLVSRAGENIPLKARGWNSLKKD